MKLALISDTHEQHNQVTIPPCDVLVHAGDLTYRGDYEGIFTAVNWLNRQPAENIVLIAGNHDWLFQLNPDAVQEIITPTKIIYLEETSITINGVQFWGSPWTPAFCNWAFNGDRAEMFKYWNKIPTNTDVLITHGPPLGILDQAAPLSNSEHLGCYDLLSVLRTRLNPKVHVFGHIHGGYGHVSTEGTQFFNASIVNEAYKVVNKPFVVEI